jgi:ABC-2 type transport system ATP-binding protein
MYAIEAHQLVKTYPGGVRALKGIDLGVAPGEVFGLLGPNGAGKSTTVGILTTTIRPSSGSAKLAGYDVARQPLLARSVASVVFQDTVLDTTMTGEANLHLHARLWGVPPERAQRRAEELVATLGLDELMGRPVSSLSGGQRRRLELARALLSDPQVLFLDEPTVGLDPRIRHELLDLIAAVRARTELTIMLTTHYLDEAQRLCDRVAIVHQGEIIALDSPAALLSGLGQELLEFRVGGDAAATLERLRESRIAGADAFAIGGRLTIPLHGIGGGAALRELDAAGVAVGDVSLRAPTLDDVYLRLTGTAV